MEESLIIFLLSVSITVSLILLAISFKWPNIGRFLFVLLFFWAAYINTKTAVVQPQDYLNYASFAWLNIYRDFINGFFAANTTAIVLTIAFCQLLIAIFLSRKGPLARLGGLMAIIFLLAIAPLGVGSGFPSTLIMAMAMILIIRKPITNNLWRLFANKISHLRAKSS